MPEPMMYECNYSRFPREQHRPGLCSGLAFGEMAMKVAVPLGGNSSDQYMEPAGPDAGGRWLIYPLRMYSPSQVRNATSRPYSQCWNMLDQNCWHRFQCGHLQNWLGFKGRVSSLYCPLLRRLPGSGWVQALGTGLSTGGLVGLWVGDDGLKDASESVNPGRLGKDPSGGGSVRAEALGRNCLMCFQKREGIDEGRGIRGHQHSAQKRGTLCLPRQWGVAGLMVLASLGQWGLG